jgi:hypothetical protein
MRIGVGFGHGVVKVYLIPVVEIPVEMDRWRTGEMK